MSRGTQAGVRRHGAGDKRLRKAGVALHPAWQSLIKLCESLGHGEIEKLKVQDGLPVHAEITTRKIKLT